MTAITRYWASIAVTAGFLFPRCWKTTHNSISVPMQFQCSSNSVTVHLRPCVLEV
jgi:hypothetical protein